MNSTVTDYLLSVRDSKQTDTVDWLSDESVNADDVSWFGAAIQGNAAKQIPDNEYMQDVLQGMSSFKDKALLSYRRAAKNSLSPDGIWDNIVRVHNYDIQTKLATKIIAKGSQAIERLTNLQ